MSGSTAPDEVRGYYDEQAPTYDTTLASWGYDAPWRVAELLLRTLPADRAPETLLDAGCGTGLAGQALRDAGFAGRLLGVDLSPDSVALAAGRGIYDDVAVGDLQQPLEYDDDSVDGVVCVGVLTYVPDVAAIWGEFCRITRPGGAIVLTQRDDLWRERAVQRSPARPRARRAMGGRPPQPAGELPPRQRRLRRRNPRALPGGASSLSRAQPYMRCARTSARSWSRPAPLVTLTDTTSPGSSRQPSANSRLRR